VLYDDPNRYSIGTPLEQSGVALLANNIMSEFNSRCAIRIFHFYKIHLTTVWPTVSVNNKYEEYFLEGKGDHCEGLTNLPLFCAPVLKSRSPGIYCVCDNFGHNLFDQTGERRNSSKWAINANELGLRYVQVSKWVCDFIVLKEC